ncbi:lysoplasmalogenase [Cellulomonas cellasea]|uniref:lysoplasmalogenase n=1 Tax=Cellulomonas cellasea TaxID=43670 RepID=UPI0025A339F9|nr:lysoplasmalogenase [Cellulomonas cellasea]MDM8085441.1 lysoplasmalogenase [Cellulomonas cellasea]
MSQVRAAITQGRGSRRSRAAVLVFGLVAAVHLVSQVAGALDVANVTQWLLMPTLVPVLLVLMPAPLDRRARLVLVGLGLSWLGDSAPDLADGSTAFLVMVAFFMLAQVAYVVAFAPDWRGSPLLRRPWLLAPYALLFVSLVAACAPAAGTLLAPVVVYGLLLLAMSVLSTGVSRAAGIGGALFFLSDALIALGEFAGLALPRQGLWVMATYIAAQALLVVGVAAARRREAEPTGDGARTRGVPEPDGRPAS